MAELKQLREECKAFAAKHLAECAAELIEWQDTAILREGKVRELSALCQGFIDNHDSLRVAESMVTRAALDAARRAEPAQASAPAAVDGIRGPLTDAQRAELRYLYSNLYHLGPGAMEDVVRRASVCGYVNGRLDFAPTKPAKQADALDAGGGAGDHVMIVIGSSKIGKTDSLAKSILEAMPDDAKKRTSYENVRDVIETFSSMNRRAANGAAGQKGGA